MKYEDVLEPRRLREEKELNKQAAAGRRGKKQQETSQSVQ
jgi:hypothetical protein